MALSSSTAAHPGHLAGPAIKRAKVEPSTDGRFTCAQCQRSFGRIEHLKRHLGSHSEERPFKCSICDKSFLRSDTLQRHEIIHDECHNKVKPKGARACLECAAAKVKCTNTLPCARCSGKGLLCKYPIEGSSDDIDGEQTPPRNQSAPTDEADESAVPAPGSSPARSGRLLPSISSITGSQKQQASDVSTSSWDQGFTSMNWVQSGTSQDVGMSLTTSSLPRRGAAQIHGHRTSASAETQHLSHGTDEASSGYSRRWLETVTQSPPLQREQASSTSGSQGQAGTSHFYVDGDGARLPKSGYRRRQTLARAPTLNQAITEHSADPAYGSFGFQAMAIPHRDIVQDLPPLNMTLIDPNTHDQLRIRFERLCIRQQSAGFGVFESPFFPSLKDFRTFVFLYLENVQPVLPILHLPTLNDTPHHWILALAVAALGCQFLDGEIAVKDSLAMQEYLRRTLIDIRESNHSEAIGVELQQAKLLHCLGMAYSGNAKLKEATSTLHVELAEYCKNEWRSARTDPKLSVDEDEVGSIQSWFAWREVEVRRRTGYAIWMLDCMLAYHNGRRPLIDLEDATIPLPCPEILWEAHPVSQWRQVMAYSAATPTLLDAIQAIYIEKKIQPTMGEFSRILVIHGLYRRNWQVRTYLEQPLTWWNPTAARQRIDEVVPTNIWLPSLPMYGKWRNATCDSLDILHWAANSVIGAASGMEHPTVAHLHLARVLMLTPITEIRSFAYGLAGPTPTDEEQLAGLRKGIRRWALEDQHKARLAMVHAGVQFWHLRKFSAAAFYEPHAVLLSTLALWAFGHFTDNDYINSRLPEPSFAEDEASLPTSINVDRPADDELVQTFIRRGSKMLAMMSGVGDVCAPEGPERILAEGVKLLSTLTNWGCGKNATRLLRSLAQVPRERIVTDM